MDKWAGRWGAAALVAVASMMATAVGVQPAASAPAAGTPAAAVATIHVPADQPTIAAALAVAVSGDTVEVAPGTYAEDVDFNGKDVHLVAPAGATIDGVVGPVIAIGPGGSVQGFEIRGGTSGGGHTIVVEGEYPLVRGNTITQNISAGDLVFAGANPIVLDRNLILDNTCVGTDAAIISPTSGNTLVLNNQLVDNSCDIAVNIGTSAHPTVAHNSVVGHRLGLSIGLSFGTIRSNLVTDNTTGVRFRDNANSGLPNYTHNLVSQNMTDYAGAPGEQNGTNNNIGGAVRLIDLAGRDLRLQPSSPAVDAGAGGATLTDFDGSDRPVDGPDADADAEYDIGAFEWDGTEPPPVLQQTGALDNEWSNDGLQDQSSRYAIALGPRTDGGTFTGVYRATDGNGPMRISNYTPTGAPAPGWGSSGYVLRAFQPGGKGVSFPTDVVPVGQHITVVGEHYGSTARLGVARLRSDGAYDSTFSGDGRALYKVFAGEHDVVSAFRADVLTGGKIGIAAIAFDYNSSGNLVFTGQAMLRLNANGTLDTTFSSDGVAVIPQNWSDVRWRPDGSSFVGVQGSITHQVRRLLPSGQLNTSFSGDGIASAACGTHRGAHMEVDSSGRPLLMCVKPTGTSTTLAIYRFTTAGGFDTSYSGDGKTLLAIPNSTGTGNNGIAGFDASAKPWALAGGPGTTKTLRIYTLDSAGAPDQSFSGDGAASIVLPFNVELSSFARVATNRLFVANFNGDVNVAMIAVKV